jgi:hypothetical protein
MLPHNPEFPFWVPGCRLVYTQPASFEPLFPCCPSLATPVTLQACKSGLFRLREELALPCFQRIPPTPPRPCLLTRPGFHPPPAASTPPAPAAPRSAVLSPRTPAASDGPACRCQFRAMPTSPAAFFSAASLRSDGDRPRPGITDRHQRKMQAERNVGRGLSQYPREHPAVHRLPDVVHLHRAR